jgi:hypothetical protein
VATNVYNGTAADLEPVAKGAKLYRIRAAGKSYAANAFNPIPKPLNDPEQGRFEPTDPALGGYLYVAPTLPGAVAEGILRNQSIPSSRLVPRAWLVHKMLAVMTLDEDIAVRGDALIATARRQVGWDKSGTVGHGGRIQPKTMSRTGDPGRIHTNQPVTQRKSPDSGAVSPTDIFAPHAKNQFT